VVGVKVVVVLPYVLGGGGATLVVDEGAVLVFILCVDVVCDDEEANDEVERESAFMNGGVSHDDVYTEIAGIFRLLSSC
jgi:hypothetical protein